SGGQVETFEGSLLVGDVAADPPVPPVACVQRLNRIRTANDLADLDVVVQEWHELAPRVLPQPSDRWVRPAPFLGELFEPGPGLGLGGGGIDRPQISGDLARVLSGGIPEGVADQVNDARLHGVNSQTVLIASGRPLEAVADRDA